MTIGEMLIQSGMLAILGLGIVFGFLIILVISVSLLGRILGSIGLKEEPQSGLSAETESLPVAGTDKKISAAISAAITEYQKTHKLN